MACATRTGTLIWKYRASSPAPDSDAISPLASLGANPCNPMLGKPTVATVPPNFTVLPLRSYAEKSI